MQIGSTDYSPKNAEYFDFVEDYAVVEKLNREARVVIGPGGAGTIITAVSQGTPIVTVPRRLKFKEHGFDDYILAEAMCKKGIVASVIYEIDDLDEAVKMEYDQPPALEHDKRLINFLKGHLNSLSK